MKTAKGLRVLAGLCIQLALLVELAAPGGRAGAAEASVAARRDTITWLSAGDSYASGEGIPGAGQGKDTCARSDLAFGPKAASILRTQRSWQIAGPVVVACTGSTIHEFYGDSVDGKKGHQGSANNNHGAQWAEARKASGNRDKYDVITLSMGGNDIGFPDVMAKCLLVRLGLVVAAGNAATLNPSWALMTAGTAPAAVVTAPSCWVDEDTLKQRIDKLVGGHSFKYPGLSWGMSGAPTLADFYAEVAKDRLTDRGVLVIAGYPRLFAPSSGWGRWHGTTCNGVNFADADMLGRTADYFDEQLRAAVDQAQARTPNRRIEYVSRRDLFRGHELCSPDVVGYMNGVQVLEARVEQSFHPNKFGHQRTAESVAGLVEAALGDPAPSQPSASSEVPSRTVPAVTGTSPPGTTPGPISDGTQMYNTGEHFSDECGPAWPFRPQRTATEVVMTLQCKRVLSDLPFWVVQVTFADPGLQLADNSWIRVTGTIVGIETRGFPNKIVVVAE